MLKLKGQTGSGEWVVFSVSDIEDADRDYTEIRLLNGDNIIYILTSTIQPSDDPRKAMLKEIRKKVSTIKAYREPASDFKFDVFDILDEMEAKL